MKLLAILTRPNDTFAQELIAHERAEIFDLTACDPDYDQLLEKIFNADSVQVF